MAPSLRIAAAAAAGRSARLLASPATTQRPLHTTPRAALPYKDTQDRESLQPRAAENTKSGRDDEAASSASSGAAFDPSKTSPEAAGASTSSGSDPLEASGANQELSKPRGDERSGRDRGAGVETKKGGASGRGQSQKQGRPGKV